MDYMASGINDPVDAILQRHTDEPPERARNASAPIPWKGPDEPGLQDAPNPVEILATGGLGALRMAGASVSQRVASILLSALPGGKGSGGDLSDRPQAAEFVGGAAPAILRYKEHSPTIAALHARPEKINVEWGFTPEQLTREGVGPNTQGIAERADVVQGRPNPEIRLNRSLGPVPSGPVTQEELLSGMGRSPGLARTAFHEPRHVANYLDYPVADRSDPVRKEFNSLQALSADPKALSAEVNRIMRSPLQNPVYIQHYNEATAQGDNRGVWNSVAHAKMHLDSIEERMRAAYAPSMQTVPPVAAPVSSSSRPSPASPTTMTSTATPGSAGSRVNEQVSAILRRFKR